MADLVRAAGVAGLRLALVDADGRVVPLVASERTYYAAPRPPEEARAPSHAAAYALVGVGLALLFGFATALSVRLPQITGAAPQLLQLIPYVVTVLALVVVGIRSTSARNRHGAWRFDV